MLHFVNPSRKIICLLVFALSGCSTYYVKLVDQDGIPIVDAEIIYATQSGNSYFTSRNPHRDKTDTNGFAELTYANQNEFFRIEKPGYQFDFRRQMLRRFGNLYGNQLKKYTKSQPLVIYGWRRGEEPELIYAIGEIVGATDHEDCFITLVEASQSATLNQDIRLRISVSSSLDENSVAQSMKQSGELKKTGTTLEVLGGRIKKTDDIFLHRADNGGYESSVTIPVLLNGESRFFYIEGDEGGYYGGAIVYAQLLTSYNPAENGPTKLRSRAEFWFNLDGSRNIMRAENADWTVGTRAGRDILRCEN